MILPLLLLATGLTVQEWGVILPLPAHAGQLSLEHRAALAGVHAGSGPYTVFVGTPLGTLSSTVPEADSGGTGFNHGVWLDLELVPAGEAGPEPGNQEEQRRPSLLYRHSLGYPGLLPYLFQGGNRSLRVEYGETPCLVISSENGVTRISETSLLPLTRREALDWRILDSPGTLRETLKGWSTTLHCDPDLWSTWEDVFIGLSSTEPHVIYRVPGRVMDDLVEIRVEAANDDATVLRFHLACVPAGPL